MKSGVLPRIRPMKLRLVKEAFDDPDFLYELKHDGFRAIAYIDRGNCRLVSRNLKALPFKSLRAALAAITVTDNAILDGEIVVLDHSGVSRFNSLLSRKGEEAAVFYAFDLIWLNGTDLRRRPLLERKEQLHELVRKSRCERLLYVQHIEGASKKFFGEICSRDLEGIVAKRKLGIYKDDGNSWMKVKNRSYSQAEGRHELLMGAKR
jgi:bifunctional non-homologous end joining protein LigD